MSFSLSLVSQLSPYLILIIDGLLLLIVKSMKQKVQ
jgi:hypothetical protein